MFGTVAKIPISGKLVLQQLPRRMPLPSTRSIPGFQKTCLPVLTPSAGFLAVIFLFPSNLDASCLGIYLYVASTKSTHDVNDFPKFLPPAMFSA